MTMTILEDYYKTVRNGNTVVIIDDATNPLFSKPFLRVLPLINLVDINLVTFPKSKGKLYSAHSIEDIKWIESNTLLKQRNLGNYGIISNMWLEENVKSCKSLLNGEINSRENGIVIVIEDDFQLNPGWRNFIEEDYSTKATQFKYSLLRNSLAKLIEHNFHTSISEPISPIMLETLAYLAIVYKQYPKTTQELIECLLEPKAHLLELCLSKYVKEKNYDINELTNILYWQLDLNKVGLKKIIRERLEENINSYIFKNDMKNKLAANYSIVTEAAKDINILYGFFSRNRLKMNDGKY